MDAPLFPNIKVCPAQMWIRDSIKAQRAKDPDTLVIDGGDFSMGTLIQTVFETQAAELRMLGYRCV